MAGRTLIFLSALALSTGLGATCHAQSNSSGSSASASVTTTSSSQASASASAQSGPKKVWTNDDLGGLQQTAAISTFAAPNAKASKPGTRPVTRGRDAKWYHDQIARLKEQIPPIDTQIAQLQDAISGKPTGDGKESTRPSGVKADQWPAELDRLQKKRSDLEGQISALEDEARHNGVASGALP